MDPLGALIVWCAEYGLLGLFVVALLERLVPVIPSYGLLVAVGIGSASGAWFMPLALLTTILGSLAGGGALYVCAALVGAERAVAFLIRFARLFGVSSSRMENLISNFRMNQAALSFGAQLTPTIRVIAPAIAGLLRANAKSFLWATGCGIAIWNSLFLGVGYAVAVFAATRNASVLALQILLALVAGDSLAFMLWHLIRRSGRLASKPDHLSPVVEGRRP
ncbi:putative membrane-associated protein [Mesorhizobium plurifarium]|uniref:Putative membrane-associated protein n=1 Tax=Mesorhizobium plurifarium TaxID=69974 RepID=A0A090GDG0_MESPL|nr:putative membrane-associated protein [Mesorhizobium plurifarium]